MISTKKSAVPLKDKPSTPSQKLRSVIYLLWEQSADKIRGVSSENFYEKRMKNIIDEQIGALLPLPSDNYYQTTNSLPPNYDGSYRPNAGK